ncbi:MAG: type II secretion system minor pseudopilin GspJ [Gammaproteobacteria bacterium]|nr:type II secretion system minor pseudopilin GspJ [Gammaproteobacteria bacterium]
MTKEQMTQALQKQNGFTLLEILIAISIFALITFSTFMLFQQALSSEQQFKKSSQSLVELQRAYRLLQQDISQIIGRSVRDEYGQSLSSFQLIDTINGKTIEFTRMGRDNPLQKSRSDLLRLQYYQQDNQLIRKSWQSLDRSLDTKQSEQIIVNQIETIQWQVLDKDQWLSSWPDTALTNNKDLLPNAIQIQISLKNKRQYRWLYPITLDTENSLVQTNTIISN